MCVCVCLYSNVFFFLFSSSSSSYYYSFFPDLFGPSAVHYLPCYLPAVILQSCLCAAVSHIDKFGNFPSALRLPIHSSAFQLAFLVQDFLPEFSILLSNILTTCPAHRYLPTRTYVNRSTNADAT